MKKTLMVVLVMAAVLVSVSNGVSAADQRTPDKAVEVFVNFHMWFDTGDPKLKDVLCKDFQHIIPRSKAKAQKIANIIYDPYHGVTADAAWNAVNNMHFDFSGMDARIVDENYIHIDAILNSTIMDPDSGVWMPVESKDVSNDYMMILENGKLVFCVAK